MNKKRASYVVTEAVKDTVKEFFKDISRTSTNKKETVLVNGQRTPVKFLEQTLSTCYAIFKETFPTVKIGEISFENL